MNHFKHSFKRSISGIFLLDKPVGMSSNKALKKVQYWFAAKKAGHTGSLDPLASGMLPICLGEATKLSQYLLEAHKRYRVTAQLGVRTASGDAEGAIIAERIVPDFTQVEIEKILNLFRGEITQIPSMYSALKHQGQPLYKYARQGVDIERKPRCIQIMELKLLAYTETRLELEVYCSKGTYIRTLVDDIGEALGCGAHVSFLRRTSVAGYAEAEMISLEQLEKTVQLDRPEILDVHLTPMMRALPHWPVVELEEHSAFYFKQGQAVMSLSQPQSEWVKVCDKQGQLLGIGQIVDHLKLAPKRLFGSI